MKTDMISCVRAVSGNSYDILEEIISSKYRKFCQLYWLIKEWSEVISSIKYKDSKKKERLRIEFEVAGVKPSTVLEDLLVRIEGNSGVLIKQVESAIVIEISREE